MMCSPQQNSLSATEMPSATSYFAPIFQVTSGLSARVGTKPAPPLALTHCRTRFQLPSVSLPPCPLLRKGRKRTKKESKKNGKRKQLREDDGGTG